MLGVLSSGSFKVIIRGSLQILLGQTGRYALVSNLSGRGCLRAFSTRIILIRLAGLIQGAELNSSVFVNTRVCAKIAGKINSRYVQNKVMF
jgi:hypothetical protein